MSARPYVQTFTAVAGSGACNCRCMHCVSKMTPNPCDDQQHPINWRNFIIGAQMANQYGSNTFLITGKGEPTLFPEQITQYLEHIKDRGYPLIELQTNGVNLAKESFDAHLLKWYKLGLTTIALSIGHYDSIENAEIVRPNVETDRFNIADLIYKLHNIDIEHHTGFSIRLTCMLVKGYIDNINEVLNLIDFARNNKVEQITIRRIERPSNPMNLDVAKYVDEHTVSLETIEYIRKIISEGGTLVRRLVHGGLVYDYHNQNICISNCLTITPDIENSADDIRQIIFFQDGHVRYAWQHLGAILL